MEAVESAAASWVLYVKSENGYQAMQKQATTARVAAQELAGCLAMLTPRYAQEFEPDFLFLHNRHSVNHKIVWMPLKQCTGVKRPGHCAVS